MPKLSKAELTHLLKALVERKAHLERMEVYPTQARDIQPYTALIRKLKTYQTERLQRGEFRSRK